MKCSPSQSLAFVQATSLPTSIYLFQVHNDIVHPTETSKSTVTKSSSTGMSKATTELILLLSILELHGLRRENAKTVQLTRTT